MSILVSPRSTTTKSPHFSSACAVLLSSLRLCLQSAGRPRTEARPRRAKFLMAAQQEKLWPGNYQYLGSRATARHHKMGDTGLVQLLDDLYQFVVAFPPPQRAVDFLAAGRRDWTTLVKFKTQNKISPHLAAGASELRSACVCVCAWNTELWHWESITGWLSTGNNHFY